MNHRALRWTSLPLYAFLLALVVLPAPSSASEAALQGRITDPQGRPVEGAMVFVYTDAEVRRNADYISPRSDQDGRYRVVLPEGTYWVVARDKHSEGYGPLMPGDRHSGDAEEIDVGAGETVKDFVVADLKDAILRKRKEREGLVRLSGRVVDAAGEPVAGSYVIASRSARVSGVPPFLSAWIGPDGRYVLYLPAGKYFIGAAREFPLPGARNLTREIEVKADQPDLDITMQ